MNFKKKKAEMLSAPAVTKTPDQTSQEQTPSGQTSPQETATRNIRRDTTRSVIVVGRQPREGGKQDDSDSITSASFF